MAEESSRSRFLSKSKWGKVFKENDSTTSDASYKLNDDVSDFLKPSIEASKEKQASTKAHLAPKLNIALAKSWPDAHDVQRAATAATSQRAEDVPMYYTRPRRRQGLMVGFVKTDPEIMGEGGDDAPDPATEISRQKVRMSRSASDRRPLPLADNTSWPLDAGRPTQRQQQPLRDLAEADTAGFIAAPLRRAQTSHNELSPPLERKHMPPPMQPPSPPQPRLNRAPTGFSSQDDTPSPTGDDQAWPMPISRPPIDTRSQPPGKLDTRYDSAVSQSPFSVANRGSPAVMKSRTMGASEGAILRRASAMFQDDDEQNGALKDPNSGIQPSPDYYNRLVDMTSGTSPETVPSRTDMLPQHGGSSPFVDPNYLKSRPRESSTMPPSRRPREEHFVQQSEAPYSRNPQPAHPPVQMRTGQPPLSLSSTRDFPVPPQRSWEAQQSSVPGDDIVNHKWPGPPSSPRQLSLFPGAQTPPRRRPDAREPQYPTAPTGRLPQETDANRTRPIDSHGSHMVPSRGAPPLPLQNMAASSQGPGRDRSRSQGRQTQIPNTQSSFGDPPQRTVDLGNRAENIPPFMPMHSRNGSVEKVSPQRGVDSAISQSQPSPQFSNYSQSPKGQRPYPTNPHQEDAARSPPLESKRSIDQSTASPQSPSQTNEAAELALVDFAGRVAHMKGVFRLTAEKERPGDHCSPQAWLRAALWWFLKGKAGLEALFHVRTKGPHGHRGLLAQPHVDLAKASWILSEALKHHDRVENADSQHEHMDTLSEQAMQNAVRKLTTHLQSLAASMAKSSLMPPHQSLIQGQDTMIWIEYPRCPLTVVAGLNGHSNTPTTPSSPVVGLSPTNALPVGDSRDDFCYGRFAVDAFLSTDDAETDRVILPCILSMVRHKRSFESGIIIASQSELMNLEVLPRAHGSRGLTWQSVTWKASTYSLHIQLPRGLDLTVRLLEADFRAVWNLVEYSRKVQASLFHEQDEKQVLEARLVELQHADSSNASAFPQDKVGGCIARIFERQVELNDGAGRRNAHRGFRLVLVTEPGHKSLSSASHELCTSTPLYFEFLTDATANGTTAMVIRTRDPTRQCKILLVFRDLASRQAFYDVLNGLSVGPGESIVTKVTLTGLNIEPVAQAAGFAAPIHPALQGLQWQRLGVTNDVSHDPNEVVPDTVESESLRVVIRHATGCITDRLNLSKGDMLLRLPCASVPAIEILRNPQEDVSMSIDTRHSPPQVPDGIAELLQTVRQQSTVRTFTFASLSDLHAFQTAITGWSILYDGTASTFGISRRMMVVPIHTKWTASNVRIQIVTRDTVTKVLAFMEDFGHTDAMVIRVKSTDIFETIKGDGKGKKWGVKMVDAKFSLPAKEERKEREKGGPGLDGGELAVRRRFVNLEGLDYAGEHDDLAVGFETEDGKLLLSSSSSSSILSIPIPPRA